MILEYLPGREFTVDCFTNAKGKLIFCKGRGRNRIKGGISVNATFHDDPRFSDYANKINNAINQIGAWFFQVREDSSGELKLMEIASRPAGASAIVRGLGVNLPLITLDAFNGIEINDVVANRYQIELDRALYNTFKLDLDYRTIYVDFDDTIVVDGKINVDVIKFLFQCVNNDKRLVLVSKHVGSLTDELNKFRIANLFDEIVHLNVNDRKSDAIDDAQSIFIDDSYGERKAVAKHCGIPVFDTCMIECLTED